MSVDREVVIVGAGPAGIATAIALVRKDASFKDRILVLDRARFPRDKPCGGGLTGHAAQALAALGLEVPVAQLPSPQAIVRCGSFEREVTLPRPVSVIRRWDFDAALLAEARRLGIAIEEERALTAWRREGRQIIVDTERGPLRTRVLCGADGAASLVRKQLLLETRGARRSQPVPIRLFRAELSAPAGRYASTMLYDFSPMAAGLRGYFWVFPMPDGKVNVGLMHYPTDEQTLSGRDLVKMLDQSLGALGYRLDGAARGWPVWGYRADLPLGGPGVLVVGDAAGVDALTGEGIAVGMEHGLLAADAISEALGSNEVDFSRFGRRVRSATVGRELALDTRLAWMLYGGARWRSWLSLILFDEKLLQLYAARVSGTAVLADERGALVAAFGRHLLRFGTRRRQLAAALG